MIPYSGYMYVSRLLALSRVLVFGVSVELGAIAALVVMCAKPCVL